MKLNEFQFNLNEQKVSNSVRDFNREVRELRALNNSADEIIKKMATRFDQPYEFVKKKILPTKLKKYAEMSKQELDNVTDKEIKELKDKYKKYFEAEELRRISSKSTFLNKLMDSFVEQG